MAHKILILLAVICSTPLLHAQQEDGIGINGNQIAVANGLNNNSRNAGSATVVEIPAMTVSYSVIDMDLLPLGQTSLAALNAVGSNGGSDLIGMTLVPNTAAAGIYNTNVCGYALAAEPGSGGTIPAIIDATGGAAFDAMDITLDLGGDSTEFGLLIADWVGAGFLTFYSGGVEVASITTSSFTSSCGELFFQMTGGTFDQVEIKVSNTVGNWCVPQMAIEQAGGPSAPTLSATNLVAGSTATLSLANANAGAVCIIAYSVYGGGPTSTPVGSVDLSPPIRQLPAVQADSAGAASLSASVPPNVGGMDVWIQAVDLSGPTLSNSLALTVQ